MRPTTSTARGAGATSASLKKLRLACAKHPRAFGQRLALPRRQVREAQPDRHGRMFTLDVENWARNAAFLSEISSCSEELPILWPSSRKLKSENYMLSEKCASSYHADRLPSADSENYTVKKCVDTGKVLMEYDPSSAKKDRPMTRPKEFFINYTHKFCGTCCLVAASEDEARELFDKVISRDPDETWKPFHYEMQHTINEELDGGCWIDEIEVDDYDEDENEDSEVEEQ
jgi:hypothetical protein